MCIFLQGESKELKDKGQVLWRAAFNDRPAFQYHQKLRGQPATFSRFLGISSDPYDSPDEDYYYNHPRHSRHHSSGHFSGSIITKWSLNTKAIITLVKIIVIV